MGLTMGSEPDHPEPAIAPDHGPRLTFRTRHRLTHAREFQAVFKARFRQSAGPITVHAKPNESSATSRLGLSIGRRAGSAVRRNRFKRVIREAFRASMPSLDAMSPEGAKFDLVVSVRPHEPRKAPEYAALLTDAVRRIERDRSRRAAKQAVRGNQDPHKDTPPRV